MPQFRQANGLTLYAFACGYIQRASVTTPEGERRVDLHKDGCWHVTVADWTQPGPPRQLWETFNNVSEARSFWQRTVRETFRTELLTMAKDHRYTYAQEHHGEQQPSWVVRFGGEWVGKSETKVGAQLAAWTHRQKLVQEAA